MAAFPTDQQRDHDLERSQRTPKGQERRGERKDGGDDNRRRRDGRILEIAPPWGHEEH